MAPLFSAISFFALIAAVISCIIWIVNKIRHKPTKAHIACMATALVAVAGFVAFGLTYEPPEKIEEPQIASTETEAVQPEETPTQAPEPPTGHRGAGGASGKPRRSAHSTARNNARAGGGNYPTPAVGDSRAAHRGRRANAGANHRANAYR